MMTQTTSELRKSQSLHRAKSSGVGTVGFLISRVPVDLARGEILQVPRQWLQMFKAALCSGLYGKCFKMKELGLGKLGRKPGKAADTVHGLQHLPPYL